MSVQSVKQLPHASSVKYLPLPSTNSSSVSPSQSLSRRSQVSALGVREGLLYRELSDEVRARDPLLEACGELAFLRSRSPRHARELSSWTDSLFSALEIDETAEERRLRNAACRRLLRSHFTRGVDPCAA